MNYFKIQPRKHTTFPQISTIMKSLVPVKPYKMKMLTEIKKQKYSLCLFLSSCFDQQVFFN